MNERLMPEDSGNADARPARDREFIGNSRGTDLRAAFLQIGVDINSPASIQEFNEALDWARLRSKRAQEHQAERRKAIWLVIAAAFGGVLSTVFAWLMSRLPGGH